MTPDETLFGTGWYGTDLRGYRECEDTYCLFPYEGLPPLLPERFTGEFAWLGVMTEKVEAETRPHRPPPAYYTKIIARLASLQDQARELNLSLPEPFIRFMSRPDWQDMIPSCTACYFDLPETIVSSPAGDGGYLIRFLNDQQGVLFWYLYLHSDGRSCVLVSPAWMDDPEFATLEQRLIDMAAAYTCFTSPTFEQFLYRFWLENSLWFALDGGTPLTPEQSRYLQALTPLS